MKFNNSVPQLHQVYFQGFVAGDRHTEQQGCGWNLPTALSQFMNDLSLSSSDNFLFTRSSRGIPSFPRRLSNKNAGSRPCQTLFPEPPALGAGGGVLRSRTAVLSAGVMYPPENTAGLGMAREGAGKLEPSPMWWAGLLTALSTETVGQT